MGRVTHYKTANFITAAISGIILLIFFVIVTPGYGADKISDTGSESSTTGSEPSVTLSERVIQLGDHKLVVEIANNPSSRQHGLMFRTSLQKKHGMLFMFDDSGRYGFWMKNTYVPLDIGFFDENRILIEFYSMEPHSLKVTRCSKKAKYALEVPQGWFKENKVKPGSKFIFLKKLNPA